MARETPQNKQTKKTQTQLFIEFFRRLGFQVVDKYSFPPKIWSDCCVCPKKDHCDETAVMIGVPVPDGVLPED